MPDDDGDATTSPTDSAASGSNEPEIAQIAVDAKLYNACRQQLMADHVFAPLAEHMGAQAFQMLCGGLKSGRISSWIRERNSQIKISVPDSICHADIEDLADETVERAIVSFKRKMANDDGWSEATGQTLKAYFHMLCLNEFPNVFRDWRTRRAREIPGLEISEVRENLATADLPETAATNSSARDGSAIESHLTARQRRAFRMLVEGFSFLQIGEAMGISVRAVKELLCRAQRRRNG